MAAAAHRCGRRTFQIITPGMEVLTPSQVSALLLSLGLMLGVARAAGEVARRFRQPAVLGEILAGVVLGKTVLGAVAPDAFRTLFPDTGPVASAQLGITLVAVTLFLLVAGLEVDLSTIGRQGRAALLVSSAGIAVPLLFGFTAAWLAPDWLGRGPSAPRTSFALFLGTALAISALPVIAKILLDLGLYRSDLGMLVMGAAMVNDLVGWLGFSLVLSMVGAGHGGIAITIPMTLAFAGLVLTLGRVLCHRALPWIQAHTTWPGGVLAFTLTLALVGAAVTEWIGVHAIFGAFLVGTAIGDSKHLRERTREHINQFVTNVFAPLFFASIGLRVNFVAHFDPLLVLCVCGLAVAGKFVGCGLGAWWAGLDRKTSLAVCAGMTPGGAMAIILGLLALQYGIIDERLLVALVVVALTTSSVSGPLVNRILGSEKPLGLLDVLDGRSFAVALRGQTSSEVIEELSSLIAPRAGLPAGQIHEAVWQREQTMSTAIGNGVAVPHARLEVRSPCVAIGLSKDGVDFNAADGQPAHCVILILTGTQAQMAQLQILASIARLMRDPATRERCLAARSYAEFRAALNVAHQSAQT